MKVREKILESALKRVHRENVALAEENKQLTEQLDRQRKCISQMEATYQEYKDTVAELRQYKKEYSELIQEIKNFRGDYYNNVEKHCDRILRDLKKNN